MGQKLSTEYKADMWRSDAISGPVFTPNYWAVKGFYEAVEKTQSRHPQFPMGKLFCRWQDQGLRCPKRSVKIFMSDADAPWMFAGPFTMGLLRSILSNSGHLGSIKRSLSPPGSWRHEVRFPQHVDGCRRNGSSTPPTAACAWTADEKQPSSRRLRRTRSRFVRWYAAQPVPHLSAAR